MKMPQIFCWINSVEPEWIAVMAMAEDGEFLASHVSSTRGFAWHDIGVNSDWKHESYRKKYPDGFEIVQVENAKTHEGLMAAYALNQARKVTVEEITESSPS